jgi:polyhydroxybutyrate depolymerase
MKKTTFNLILITLVVLSQPSFAALDSIFDQNVWRTFIVKVPNNYNSNNKYSLVVNLHGLNSNAAQQQTYSQFDNVANVNNFIVVYPNAIAGSWNINGNSDVDFISRLIDTVRNRYSCNTCLFITGMSQGGFLTYKLACSLPKPIKAIAVVSGNMSQNLQSSCVISSGLPVIHFHGTVDPLVNYNGTVGIPPVPTTISWWVTKNNCNSTPVFSALPNTNLSDSSNVEKYYYGGGTNGSEMTFYKIIKGGHTWPGASPVPPFGFTNLDINASQIIGSFFSQYCSNISGIPQFTRKNLSVYPNPFFDRIQIDNVTGLENYELLNAFGQIVWKGKDIESQNFLYLPNGLYFLKVSDRIGEQTLKIIKQ